MRSFVLVGLTLAVLSALAAPLQAQEAAPKLTNETCPVMVGEPVDPELYVDYKGKRVYVCCEGCIEDFKADPESYLHLLPQFADDREAGEEADEKAEHAIGALHPALVHFPIALSMAAALAAILSFLFAKDFFRSAWTYLIVFAAVAAIPAFLVGEEAEDLMGRMSDAREEAVHHHEDWGETTLYVLLGVAAFHLLTRFWPDSKALTILALVGVLAAAALAGYTGYLGGEVARPGHLDALLGSLKP